jgi:ParB-like chromosome segregation protein Spo0J
VPLAALRPYERNARTHSPQQIAEIAASMQRFGWTMPILIDENRRVIAGHGRVMAAQTLGIEEGPCIIAEGWSEEEKRAYVLADNKLSLNAGWDAALLLEELASLSPDLRALTGFSEDELAELSDPLGTRGGATPGNLADRFGVPPFSVLRAAEGWWQSRKAGWLALGIESEVGRGENLLRFSETILEPDPTKRKAREHTADLKNSSLTLNTTTDPYREKGKRGRPKAEAFGSGSAGNGGKGGTTGDRIFRQAKHKPAGKRGTDEDLRGGLAYRMTPKGYRGPAKRKAKKEAAE